MRANLPTSLSFVVLLFILIVYFAVVIGTAVTTDVVTTAETGIEAEITEEITGVAMDVGKFYSVSRSLSCAVSAPFSRLFFLVRYVDFEYCK